MYSKFSEIEMMSIEANILEIKSILPSETKLIAISKTKPVEDILTAYRAGQRLFGENKVQELVDKYENLPKDIEWHMIGHLQSNKVKYIAPFISLIHSVDSLSILQEINKQAIKNNRNINCLLQIYIAKENTKFGLSENEIYELVNSPLFRELKNITICGLMGMASNTEDDQMIADEFRQLRNIFENLKQTVFHEKTYFKELSMGMSSDFRIAITEGSTYVRIGSIIFGKRIYLTK